MLRGIKYALALLFCGAGLVRLVLGPRVDSPLGWWADAGGIAWALDTLLLIAAGVSWFLWARWGRPSISQVGLPAATEPGAVSTNGRSIRGPLIGAALITALIVGVVTVAAIDTGLNNGYSHTVIVQEAQPASTLQMATSYYDIEVTDIPVCGDDHAYQACAYMHVAMWNSACTNRDLTYEGFEICGELRDTMREMVERSEECGPNCNTQASEDGRWGWNYIWPVTEFAPVPANDAVEMIVHEEHCHFSLGNLTLGSCPGPEFAD